MKKIYFSLLALCAGISLSAEVVSLNEAKSVAKMHFASSSVSLAWDGIDQSTKSSDSEEPAFYVFNNPAGGWVIIAGDNCAEPILAESATGSFNAEAIPVNFRNYMAGIAHNIAIARRAKIIPKTSVRSKWQSVGSTKASAQQKLIETASWNQEKPYNAYCPKQSGKDTYTGCVATAMAIVLRHNRWPEQGKGTIPAYTTETSNIKVSSINIEGYSYNWDNMPLTYGNSATKPQEEAVARLMQHLGAMVEMDYTSSSSGAYSTNIIPALSKYMSYSASAVELYRMNHSPYEWLSMIKAEIDADRPIIYGGADLVDGESGHQFICDGYDSNGKIHINWGWSGKFNAWYALNYLGDTSSTGVNGVFSYYDSAIFGLVPDKNGTSKEGIDLMLMGDDTKNAGIMLSSGTVAPGNTFNLSVSYICNAYTSAYSGKVKFCLVGRDGKVKADISQSRSLSVEASSDEYYGSAKLTNISCTLPANAVMGDYISLYYTMADGTWTRMPGSNITDVLNSKKSMYTIDRFGVYDIAYINIPDNLAIGNILYFDILPGQRLIKSIKWYYDGTQATKGKEYATVSSGKHTIKAVISYCDGGTETVQRVISF